MKTKQKWKIGDCLQLLPEIPDKSIDMILTDMPYGTTACSWDKTIKIDCLFAEYRRIIKNNGATILTASQPFTSILVMSAPDLFKYELIWDKRISSGALNADVMPLKIHENILVFGNGRTKYNKQMRRGRRRVERPADIPNGDIRQDKSIVRRQYKNPTGQYNPTSILEFSNGNRNTRDRFHPTQKPLELFEYLIKTYTNEGDMVHDSCLGSGTTLEACMNLNRNCIGFEIDPQWEPIYRKRLKVDTVKLDAFNTSACPK